MSADLIHMHPVHFEDDGTLIFEVQVLESDSWRKHKTVKTQIFRNANNQVLVVKPEDKADGVAIFATKTDQEIEEESGIIFNIHIFEDSKPRKFPVAFSTKWNNKTYIMCIEEVGNQMKVTFRERDIPTYISEDVSSMIFFKIPFSEGDRQFYMFESTIKENYFLAFEKDENNITHLIIKRKEDEIDQFTRLSYSAPPNTLRNQ
uniref:Interleukin 18 n=1 Tax=Salvator merianae TaxID=96440 RepID=A0A8D0E6W4_SALMN